MLRTKVKGWRTKPASNPNSEPNFYSMLPAPESTPTASSKSYMNNFPSKRKTNGVGEDTNTNTSDISRAAASTTIGSDSLSYNNHIFLKSKTESPDIILSDTLLQLSTRPLLSNNNNGNIYTP